MEDTQEKANTPVSKIPPLVTLNPTLKPTPPSQSAAHYSHEEKARSKGLVRTLGSQEMSFVDPKADPKLAIEKVAEKATGGAAAATPKDMLAQARYEILKKRVAMSREEKIALEKRRLLQGERHEGYLHNKVKIPEPTKVSWRRRLSTLFSNLKSLIKTPTPEQGAA